MIVLHKYFNFLSWRLVLMFWTQIKNQVIHRYHYNITSWLFFSSTQDYTWSLSWLHSEALFLWTHFYSIFIFFPSTPTHSKSYNLLTKIDFWKLESNPRTSGYEPTLLTTWPIWTSITLYNLPVTSSCWLFVLLRTFILVRYVWLIICQLKRLLSTKIFLTRKKLNFLCINFFRNQKFN